ncbi:MAG: GDSL-type esterase/lipase family protein [Clostridia bacterium]|nr:GDSL-type esterase/lipase family protein [Clostridia bacterium]
MENRTRENTSVNHTRTAKATEGLQYRKNRSPASQRRAAQRKAAKKQARKSTLENIITGFKNLVVNTLFKNGKLNTKALAVPVGVIALIILISIISNVSGSSNNIVKSSRDINEGVAYIKGLEAVDTSEIEATIQHRKKMQRLEALQNGTMSVWAQFDDSVIMGDSRAVGFYYYEFTPEERTLAEAGATILAIDDHLDDLKRLNPSNVFVCYGLNDISIGIWDNKEDYCQSMKEQVEKIKSVCPNATVYISSIIPATDPAFETSTAWLQIPEYNDALKAMCEDLDWPFIDNSDVVEEYKDHYQPDGIHLETVFYEPWALNMISEVMDYESAHSGEE